MAGHRSDGEDDRVEDRGAEELIRQRRGVVVQPAQGASPDSMLLNVSDWKLVRIVEGHRVDEQGTEVDGRRGANR
jgi:hypothetical protein